MIHTTVSIDIPGFSSGAGSWDTEVGEDVLEAARKLGSRYYQREGDTVIHGTGSGFGVIMRGKTNRMTIVRHGKLFDSFTAEEMEEFATNIGKWKPSSITMCVCNAADSPNTASSSRN